MTITPFKWRDEYLVNNETASSQTEPEVAVLADGKYIVTWQDQSHVGGDATGWAVKAKLYSATGEPLTSEFLVNTYTSGHQHETTTTALANGGFVIAYSSAFQTDIKAQVFDTNATPVGSELDLNSIATGTRGLSHITALDNGGFIATWTDESAGNQDIVVRRFGADGTPADAADIVVNNAAGDQTNSEVTILAGGAFVVVWEDQNDTGNGSDIKGQRFTSAGAKDGGEFTINSTLTGDQADPSVATLSNGNFVVVWGDSAIHAHVFNPAGVEVVAQFQVSANQGPLASEVIALNDGGFLISWSEILPVSVADIRVQRYDATGQPVGNTITVNTINSSLQYNPDFDITDDGRLVVVWQDYSASADDPEFTAIRSQILSLTTDNSSGTSSGETIIGNANVNIIHGQGGDDTIHGHGGHDILSGGTGNDVIIGGSGIDTMDGGDGIGDWVSYLGTNFDFDVNLETGVTTLVGETAVNFEYIEIGNGDNVIIGNSADNIINTFGGNDTIDGADGMDQINGGAGNDRVTYDAADDLANILGGADIDTLVIIGGVAPIDFDLGAHQFELAEHSFGITGGAQRDTYNTDWQRTDRTIYQNDGSRSETIFDPTNATDTVQIDNNFDASGTYVSQTGFYDAGGRWAAQFNIPGPNDYIYNYFDAADRLDYTNGRFDTGPTFLEDTDQGNQFDWTNKYAVNTASNQADYQYDYYDNGTRSYLDHDQDGVEIYLYQYTFYDVNDDPDYYYGKYNNGDDYYFDL